MQLNRLEHDFSLLPHLKINSKCMNNFNVNPEAVKLLKASREETLPAVSCVAQKMRPIIDKQNHIKLKGSLLFK